MKSEPGWIQIMVLNNVDYCFVCSQHFFTEKSNNSMWTLLLKLYNLMPDKDSQKIVNAHERYLSKDV